MSPSLPIVRLRPNADSRAVRHGFPWVYANELVLDRRTKALAPGSLAVLEDAERRPMGVVTVNTASKIIARMLDPDPEAQIGKAWFSARLQRALDHRIALYAPQEAYRLVHAEADGLPGIVIDRFRDVFVIQPNAAWADAHLDELVTALKDIFSSPTLIKNGQGRARKF